MSPYGRAPLDVDELIRWTRLDGEQCATRLGLALLLTFYEQRDYFPRGREELLDEEATP